MSLLKTGIDLHTESVITGVVTNTLESPRDAVQYDEKLDLLKHEDFPTPHLKGLLIRKCLLNKHSNLKVKNAKKSSSKAGTLKGKTTVDRDLNFSDTETKNSSVRVLEVVESIKQMTAPLMEEEVPNTTDGINPRAQELRKKALLMVGLLSRIVSNAPPTALTSEDEVQCSKAIQDAISSKFCRFS